MKIPLKNSFAKRIRKKRGIVKNFFIKHFHKKEIKLRNSNLIQFKYNSNSYKGRCLLYIRNK